MKYSNGQMYQYREQLKNLLERKDKLGYAAARNTRLLNTELTEFDKTKNDLIIKYGTKEVDKNGNETGNVIIKPDNERINDFLEEMERYSTIEHDVNLFQLNYTDAIGQLSGKELLDLDFMFKDE